MSQKEITYLKRSLSKDEEIKSIAELHWINWIWVCILIIISILLIASSPIFLILIPYIIIKILDLKKREMICTNKRIIEKHGIIAVKTNELRNQKIESISIAQGFFGRMLGYGTLIFVGSGTSRVYMRNISSPAMKKAEFESIIEASLENK